MLNFEPTKEQKRAVVEGTLKNLGVQIYDSEIGKRVADRIGDEKLAGRHIETLERLEKVKDELLQILAEIDAPVSKG